MSTIVAMFRDSPIARDDYEAEVGVGIIYVF